MATARGVRGRAVRAVALRHEVDMPIVEQICRVLYEGAEARVAVTALMGRQLKSEDGDWIPGWED